MKHFHYSIFFLACCLFCLSSHVIAQEDPQLIPVVPNDGNQDAPQPTPALPADAPADAPAAPPAAPPAPTDTTLGSLATDSQTDGISASDPLSETSSSDPNSSSSSDTGGLSYTAKIALFVSMPAVGMILIICIFLLLNKKRKSKDDKDDSTTQQKFTSRLSGAGKSLEAPAPNIYTKLSEASMSETK